jgi:hypothetical protein
MSALPIVTREEAIERGLRRYFTGQPCKRGHVGERYTLNAGCLQCMNESQTRARDAIHAKRQQAPAA